MDCWQLCNIGGQPVWQWIDAGSGVVARMDDIDFDKLLEYTREGATFNGLPYLTRPAHWHKRLYVDRDGWTYIFGGLRHVTLAHPNIKGMAWESVNGNRADVRVCNVALVEHVNNSVFPGVYFDGRSYHAAVNGRRVGKAFEDAEDAYRWAQESWLPVDRFGREWALDNMHVFDEHAELMY
jgi:hypothetical protein